MNAITLPTQLAAAPRGTVRPKPVHSYTPTNPAPSKPGGRKRTWRKEAERVKQDEVASRARPDNNTIGPVTTVSLAGREAMQGIAAPATSCSKAAPVNLPLYVYPSDENHLPFTAEIPVRFNWTGIITADLRRRIERDVDLLIALLDALEPDPDLDGGVGDEDGCDVEDVQGEPSLGWTNEGGGIYALNDLELDIADEEDDDPAECNGDLENATAEDGCEPSDGYDIGGHALTNAAWCPA